VKGQGIRRLPDITAARIEQALDQLVLGPRGVKARTRNAYLAAVKGFCTWLAKAGRLPESPVRSVAAVKVLDEESACFTMAEVQAILEAAATAPARYGMTGPARALLYRLAVETGYRAGELRSLTRSSFDLKCVPPTVRLLAGCAKGKRRSTIQLRSQTAALLRQHLATKLPRSAAFADMPDFRQTARMIRDDMADAGVPLCDDSGRKRGFHSLRHTCGTWLASLGAHPKVIQQIMRHSTIRLTMEKYVHMDAAQAAAAVAKFPELSYPAPQVAAATGTDDATAIRLQDGQSAAQTTARHRRRRHRASAPVGASDEEDETVSACKKASNGAERPLDASWERLDLNQRRLRRQIYSLIPLTTRAHSQGTKQCTRSARGRQGRLPAEWKKRAPY